jgi:non-specific serine/threonine protein kinase
LQQKHQLKLLWIQSLERCAWVAADLHQAQRAARLFGASEAAREWIGAPLKPGEMPIYDRHLARVRANLNTNTFDAAWAEGRKMTLEQAIEFALEESRDNSSFST